MLTRTIAVVRPLIVLLALLVNSRPAPAISVAHVNLDELTRRADKIVRGTVVEATPGVARIGGHELPVVTYRIRVAERFKGAVQREKDGQYVEVRMLAGLSPRAGAPGRAAAGHPELPSLDKGATYLLFVSAPSDAGLSTTIGLGQGKYRVTGVGERERAVNDFDNRALFRGMKGEREDTHGPIAYGHLSEGIRRLVRAGGS